MPSKDDRLTPETLRPLLRTRHFGAEIHHFARIPSTQQAALAAAQAGAPEGAVFLADSQTAGRGRHGHTWESPAGAGIYLSLLLRPAWPPGEILWLTLAVALAVADAVADVAQLQAQLRWPNDLLLDEKKFCGLLMEASAEAAILGIGINLHRQAFPPGLAAIATALDEHASQPVSRPHLCAALLARLEARYFGFRVGDHTALAEEFERRCPSVRGLAVSVGGPDGDHGVTEGLDANAFLRLRLPDGSLRTVVHGDVRPAGNGRLSPSGAKPS